MDVLVDEFWRDQTIDGQPQKIPGYFVRSTAPINIEDNELENEADEVTPTIYDVVECLYQNSQSNPSYTGLVIQIHGYNTGVKKTIQNGKEVDGPDYIRLGWTDICKYLNQRDSAIFDKSNSFVYLGYRWPSESVPASLYSAATSLPIILKILFRSGLVIALLGLISLFLFLPGL